MINNNNEATTIYNITNLTPVEIKEIVFNYYGASLNPIHNKRRKKKYVEVRYMVFYIVKKELKKTLSEIGSIFHKDYATALYGIKTMTFLINTYSVYRNDYESIKRKIEDVKKLYTGETDVKGDKIFYEKSILKLPDGTIAKIIFDNGKLAAYFVREEDNSCIIELDGVNNHKSFYLRDCEVIN